MDTHSYSYKVQVATSTIPTVVPTVFRVDICTHAFQQMSQRLCCHHSIPRPQNRDQHVQFDTSSSCEYADRCPMAHQVKKQ